MAVKLTKETKQMLRGVVKLMEKNLEHIDMSTWIEITRKKDSSPEHPCGTTGCIAGYICLYNNYSNKFIQYLSDSVPTVEEFKIPRGATKPPIEFPKEIDCIDPGELAHILMGLSPEFNSLSLFVHSDWPEPFRTDYRDLLDIYGCEISPENRKAAGKVVIKRLKHFIKTGE